MLLNTHTFSPNSHNFYLRHSPSLQLPLQNFLPPSLYNIKRLFCRSGRSCFRHFVFTQRSVHYGQWHVFTCRWRCIERHEPVKLTTFLLLTKHRNITGLILYTVDIIFIVWFETCDFLLAASIWSVHSMISTRLANYSTKETQCKKFFEK